MYEVRITRDDPEHERKRISFVRSVPRRMHRILLAAAAEERRTHTYRNRTFDLQNGTQASEIRESGDEIAIELSMDTEYASYVVDRGFSQFREIAERAADQIATMIERGAEED